jgi:hypothetical protein
MKFGRRMVLFFSRPVYRALFDGPLTEINTRLQRVESLSSQLRDAEANLAAQMHNLRAELVPYLQRAEANNAGLSAQLRGLDASFAEKLRNSEANRGNDPVSVAHWNAIEQLVLALFRLPESRAWESSSAPDAHPEALPDRNGLHATSNLR